MEDTIEAAIIDFRYMLGKQKKDPRTCNSYRNVIFEFADVCEITYI